MRSVWDVIIVGAGPAGMAAAIETASRGLLTLVLDRQSEAGGQIYKSIGSSALSGKLGADYSAGLPLLQGFQNCGAVFTPCANVWDVAADRVYVSVDAESLPAGPPGRACCRSHGTACSPARLDIARSYRLRSIGYPA